MTPDHWRNLFVLAFVVALVLGLSPKAHERRKARKTKTNPTRYRGYCSRDY